MTEPEVQTALAKLTANKLGVDESKSVVACSVVLFLPNEQPPVTGSGQDLVMLALWRNLAMLGSMLHLVVSLALLSSL